MREEIDLKNICFCDDGDMIYDEDGKTPLTKDICINILKDKVNHYKKLSQSLAERLNELEEICYDDNGDIYWSSNGEYVNE